MAGDDTRGVNSPALVTATAEEVGDVIAYWAAVAAFHRGDCVQLPLPPSAEVLHRAAAFQQQQRALLCEHHTLTFSFGDTPRCSDCDRPVRLVSDLQAEAGQWTP